MTREEIHQAISRALHEVAPEVDPASIPPEADLREEADLDSLDFLRFVIALGGRLGVEIPEADYGQVRSWAALERYLQGHLEPGAPGRA